MKIELASLPARMSNWSGGPDLNRRPSPWEGDILPLNYRRESDSQRYYNINVGELKHSQGELHLDYQVYLHLQFQPIYIHLHML